jgi:methyltransferase family protein
MMPGRAVCALREAVSHTPVLGAVARKIKRVLLPGDEFRSPDYWESRYLSGGNSGAGSYGRLARFKADILNTFVRQNGVQSVVEFGCGDGAQLMLAHYPQYTGIDVSKRAVAQCRLIFKRDPTKRFHDLASPEAEGARADLSLSLDVIYHLVEDEIYRAYMRRLFAAASKYVCIYSSNFERIGPEPHIRHRRFTDWVSECVPGWLLIQQIKNPYPHDPRRPQDTSWADMFFLVRR